MLINVASTSVFSVLPEDLAEQSRQKYQQLQVLKVVVFHWQGIAFGIPEIAVLRVISLASEDPETLINQGQLDWQGIPVQILTPRRPEEVGASTSESLKFMIIFRLQNGRILGLLSATIPDSVSISLSHFTVIISEPSLTNPASTLSQIPSPFGSWVKFLAQPNLDNGSGSQFSEALYLLDLELIQQFC